MEEIEQTTEQPQAPVESTEAPQESPAPSEAEVQQDALASAKANEITEGGHDPQGYAEGYVPDLKYRIKNNEFAFDEWSHPFIKDKETEENFRQLYTAAKALDGVKESRDRIQSEFDQVSTSHREVLDSISRLRDTVQNRDFENFFKQLNIPKDWVQKWMVQDLQRAQMTPEQREQYDQRWSTVREASDLRRENEYLSQQNEEMTAQAHERELDRVLQDPSTNQFMQSYDARQGRVGAFRDAVINYAVGHYQASGTDMTAQEAVSAILSFSGAQPQQAGAAAPQAQPQVVAPQQKPVIPNIQGRSSSPVKKVPKSIEELRRQVHERFGDD